jgi:hypothetical protein
VPACQREVSYHNDNPSGSGDHVTANLTGRITDPENVPVQGAIVKAGSESVTTDINGTFQIKNVRIDKNAGFVKVEKPGFFQGSRTLTVNAGATNYISIQLIKKNVSGAINGNSSGTVTIANGGTIAFTPGSFINTANNTAYTGTVSVSAFFLDPAAANFNQIMPGTLRGINATNEETGLQSFGMMAVELNGAAGEKLQLASGKPATVTFPIPADLLAQAPATIPLWRFNDTTGLWKEEGTATRQGNNYVGTVTHFSFWNCDYPYALVDFKAVIKDQAGHPLFPAKVELKATDDPVSSYGYGYTDSDGKVSGKIPAGKTFQLKVFGTCQNALHSQTIGPFSGKGDIGTVTVANEAMSQVTFSGTATNCTMGAVANGFVDVSIESTHYRGLITNGSFNITVTRCSNATTTVGITAYDLDANQNGAVANVAITGNTVQVGQLSACGNAIAAFVNYTLNGAATSFVPPADSLMLIKNTGNSFSLYANRRNQSNEMVYLSFTASGTGSVPGSYINIAKGNNSYMNQGAFTVNITEFGNAGGYVSGNLSTTLKDSFSTSKPSINLTFRAKKMN